jgi:hypothetical protein
MNVNEALRQVFDAGEANGTGDSWWAMQDPDLIFGAVREVALREIILAVLEQVVPERYSDFQRLVEDIMGRFSP